MDECGEATVPDALIPLSRFMPFRVVLVGDDMQLPPVVLYEGARRGGLDVSLFARLRHLGIDTNLLTIQYRMTPDIMRFSSNKFYHGRLQSRPASTAYDPNGPIQWETKLRFSSTYHLAALQALRRQLWTATTTSLKPNWHTPLSNILCTSSKALHVILGLSLPIELKWHSLLNATVGRDIPGVIVSTVTNMHGKEIDVTIVSLVRARDSKGRLPKNIGFVADSRRLNVALTRAHVHHRRFGGFDWLSIFIGLAEDYSRHRGFYHFETFRYMLVPRLNKAFEAQNQAKTSQVATVRTTNQHQRFLPFVEAAIEGVELRALIDSGAQISLIDLDTPKSLEIEIQPTATECIGLGCGRLPVVGQARLHVQVGSRIDNTLFHVFASGGITGNPVVLGWNLLDDQWRLLDTLAEFFELPDDDFDSWREAEECTVA